MTLQFLKPSLESHSLDYSIRMLRTFSFSHGKVWHLTGKSEILNFVDILIVVVADYLLTLNGLVFSFKTGKN